MEQIKQGESITITGVLKDDNGVLVTDFADKKLSVILMGDKQDIINSWCSVAGIGMSDLMISPNGVIYLIVPGDNTIDMVGTYLFEFKITAGTVLIGKQVVSIQVLNSKIGREASL